MSNIISRYEAGLRFTMTHESTGMAVLTDPPVGHGGSGVSFTPTDLLEAALASCTGTILCAKAKSMGLDSTGLTVSSSHEMADGPRRIGSFEITINVPFTPDERQRKSLIAAAKSCPVRNTLRTDALVKLTVKWADGTTDLAE